MRRLSAAVLTVVISLGMASPARGQYSAIAAPFHSAGDRFSENIGVGWGVEGRNFFFHNGGVGNAPPPFGLHDPGADGVFGFQGRAGDTNFFFRLQAGQRSNRTFVSQTPTIVVPHGGTGALFDGRWRPFVTGVIPVVGASPPLAPPHAGPHVVSPLAERLWRLRAEEALKAAPPSKNSEAQKPKPHPAPPPPPREDDPPLILGAKTAGD